MAYLTIRRSVVTALAYAISITALASCDDDNGVTSPTGFIAASIQSDADIFGVMHESNLGEIAAGELAEEHASDSAVQAFATEMVEDHTILDQQASVLASSLGVTPTLPDSTLPRLQEQEMDALENAADATGEQAKANFDRTYMDQQVTAHTRTLELTDTSISRAQNGELRAMLQAQVRPVVQRHLEMAEQILSRIGQPVAAYQEFEEAHELVLKSSVERTSTSLAVHRASVHFVPSGPVSATAEE
jgi:putative membrane protein